MREKNNNNSLSEGNLVKIFYVEKVRDLQPQPGATDTSGGDRQTFNSNATTLLKELHRRAEISPFNKWITHLTRLASSLLTATATHTSSCVSSCKQIEDESSPEC